MYNEDKKAGWWMLVGRSMRVNLRMTGTSLREHGDGTKAFIILKLHKGK